MILMGDIQSIVHGLIEKHPALARVRILDDDGTYPQIPKREEALNTAGVLIVVGLVATGPAESMAESGHTSYQGQISVCCECNPAVSRSSTGTNLPAPTAAEHVAAAVVGKPLTEDNRFQLDSGEPFLNLSPENGIHRFAVNFTIARLIEPLP